MDITGREYIYGIAQDKSGTPYLFNVGELIRCKDCRYYECGGLPCPLDVCESLGDDGFCSCGERKGGEAE